MPHSSVPDLIQVLRKTLQKLEESEHIRPDDRALIELRRSILRMIAELEIAKSSKSIAA